MKKVISILICLLLVIGISITACATDVDLIQPDTTTFIYGITGYDVPVNGTLPTPTPGQIVIIAPIWNSQLPGESIPNNNNNNNNNTPAAEEEPATEENGEPLLTALQTEILALTNAERVKEKLNGLEYNFELQKAADIRAEEAAKQFSHTRPDGTEFATVIDGSIEYLIAGENLLLIDKPICTAEIIVDTWMNSEGHRANILSNEFVSIAIGVCEKDGVVYIAQLFIG